MGLFKPAWQKGNTDKALRIIDKAKGYGILVRISNEAVDSHVRLAAQMKLADVYVIQTSNYITRNTVMATITEPQAFVDIARRCDDRGTRQKALGQLMDKNDIIDVVMYTSYTDVCVTAIGRITDQAELLDIINKAYSSDAKIQAILRITDQTALISIAQDNRLHVEVRRYALDKITDQNIVADIAKRDSNRDMRIIAVARVKDEALLYEISLYNKHIENIYVRIEAVKRIRNQEWLADIAKNDCGIHVRLEAVKNLEKQDVLFDIYRNDEDSHVREATIPRITRPDSLAFIACNHHEIKICREAVLRINPKHALAQDAFAKVAKQAKQEKIRQLAVSKLSDSNLLSDILKTETSEEIRRIALKMIRDERVLVDIITSNSVKYSFEYRLAIKNIEHKGILEDLARNGSDPELRSEACAKFCGHDIDGYNDCICRICNTSQHSYAWKNDSEMKCRICGVEVYYGDR